MDENQSRAQRRKAAIEAKWGDPRIATMRLLGQYSDDPCEPASSQAMESDESRQNSGNGIRRQFESQHETRTEEQAQRDQAALEAKWADPKLAALRLLGRLSDDEVPSRDSLEQRWNKRGGFEQNRGWFSPEGAAGDPSHWYLPSAKKGKWSNDEGNSTFRLNEPIKVNGKPVRDIVYKDGLPVLDKFALPGKTASVILTGDSKTDIRNAQTAWKKLNPGKTLPGKSTFHHDLMHVAEETVEINGKKTTVLVGKMHLVPTELHKMIFHEGSASVARKYYRGLGTDIDAVKRLARNAAASAGKATAKAAGKEAAADAAEKAADVVKRGVDKIKKGKLSKGVRAFVGRNVVRAIPIVGTGLAILEFADNVEAHGVGGAVARGVPVLGALISAHDLGSEVAKEIRDDATASLDHTAQEINAPVDEAWHEANQQTLEAFNELAPSIKVTNPYGPNGYVDPQEISAALSSYRGRMHEANLLRASKKVGGFDFEAAAARNKEELKQRLTQACQNRAPRAGRSLL